MGLKYVGGIVAPRVGVLWSTQRCCTPFCICWCFYVLVSFLCWLIFASYVLLAWSKVLWFKPLFDRKVLSQCRNFAMSSSFSLIRTDAMNSGVSFDIFTFKHLLSIVLELIATLCAPKIYFEDSKIYQSHCRRICESFETY